MAIARSGEPADLAAEMDATTARAMARTKPALRLQNLHLGG